MRSIVEIEISVPQERVAALFADPRLNTQWMDDIERVEPVSGPLGAVGSKYRLVPKKGNLVFVATVLAKDLPDVLRLKLDASNVTVPVKGTFVPVNSVKTRLISEEEFRFKGFLGSALGFLGQRAIKRAHRHHMESFKRFAETHR